jgi:hypothetical protein
MEESMNCDKCPNCNGPYIEPSRWFQIGRCWYCGSRRKPAMDGLVVIPGNKYSVFVGKARNMAIGDRARVIGRD